MMQLQGHYDGWSKSWSLSLPMGLVESDIWNNVILLSIHSEWSGIANSLNLSPIEGAQVQTCFIYFFA